MNADSPIAPPVLSIKQKFETAYILNSFLMLNQLFIRDLQGLSLPVIKDLLGHYHLDLWIFVNQVPGFKVLHSILLVELLKALSSSKRERYRQT